MRSVEYRVKVPDSGNTVSGRFPENGRLYVQDGQQVSLDLNSQGVAGYQRAGSTLEVRLATGETLYLDNFFNDNVDGQLFLSQNGTAQSVYFGNDEGDGQLAADYVYVDTANKASPMDDLIFYEADVASPVTSTDGSIPPWALGAGAALLLGGGIAALASGGGGGNDDDDETAPTTGTHLNVTIDPTGYEDGILNNAEVTDDGGIQFNGRTAPGADVVVSFMGQEITTTADENGAYTVLFDKSVLPPEYLTSTGAYPGPEVTATASTDEGLTATTSRPVPLDLLAEVAIDGNVAGDGVINSAEAAEGFTLTGTTEPGETEVMVSFNGTDYPAMVNTADGTWSVDIPAADIPTDVDAVAIVASATDAVSNTARTSALTVPVDTIVENLTGQCPPKEDSNNDHVLNAQEAASGITLEGTTEIGSRSVNVTLTDSNGTASQYAAVIADDGSWSVDVPREALADGASYSISVSAEDAAGNLSEITKADCFTTDFTGPEAISVELVSYNAAGATEGIFIATPEYDPIMQTIDGDGTLAELSPETFEAGSRTILETNAEPIVDGRDVILSQADAAGNMTSTYLALTDTNPALELDADALAGLNVNTIDMSFAANSSLTLTPELVGALAETAGELTVLGNRDVNTGIKDDTVTMVGATDTNEDRVVDGQTLSVYEFGEATVLVDDEVEVVTSSSV